MRKGSNGAAFTVSQTAAVQLPGTSDSSAAQQVLSWQCSRGSGFLAASVACVSELPAEWLRILMFSAFLYIDVRGMWAVPAEHQCVGLDLPCKQSRVWVCGWRGADNISIH